ncbi:MAG: UDP-N-acetylmuramoyl-L-alanine--D-glutamate ligase [Flavobacteriales bacterium]|nr:UDP-N-acetylmuramoyl-L-alanine--D-glutamate ligase [Flavobacteriales bacterium]
MKNIVILGAGESGVGAALLAKKQGYNLFVSDKNKIKDKYRNILIENNIAFEEEKHTEEKIITATECIKSPGIPDKSDIIKILTEKQIPIISEIEFAGRFTRAKKICITGSNGKTTTTLLTYHILKKAGFDVLLAGNVGKSMAAAIAEKDYDYIVIELSSFQLDGMFRFKADVAILLNITPDHLDRYNYEFQNYIDSKFKITNNQHSSDAFIYCQDDEVIQNELKKRKLPSQLFPFSILQKVDSGGYLNNQHLIINLNNPPINMSIHELALQGKHNIYNSLAASIAARFLDVSKEIIRESLSDFQNIEHRLEFVANIHGIEFINDSKATNVNSTWYALESATKPVIWIAGGVDKGNDYSSLAPLVKQKVKGIVCLGKDNSKIHAAFDEMIPQIADVSSATDAVQYAYKMAKAGFIVLLSPACASFDLFENYEDRGHQFKQAVKNL